MKSVRIRSFSGLYFPTFKLNTERYSVPFRIQSKCGKIRTKKTPNADTLRSVLEFVIILHILEPQVIFIVSLFNFLFHIHFNLITVRLWSHFKEAPHFEVIIIIVIIIIIMTVLFSVN